MKKPRYFSHDTNSMQDPKMMMLFSECGVAGIGLFWIIIEAMHLQCDGIAEAMLNNYIDFYGKQGMCSPDVLDKFKKVVFEVKLLINENGNVFSERVKNNIKTQNELSEKARKNALKRWHRNAMALPPQCEPNALKEKKIKEKKDFKDNGISSFEAEVKDLEAQKGRLLTRFEKEVVKRGRQDCEVCGHSRFSEVSCFHENQKNGFV